MKDKTYLVNRVTTANGPQLVAILYEELLEVLRDSITSMEADNFQEVQLFVEKGRDILSELIATLEGTSEIAKNLRSIYLYTNRLMTEAVNKKDSLRFEEAIKILTPLYEGWRQLGEDTNVNSSHQGTTRITGFTYGKGQLNDYILDENKWKKG